MSASHLNVLLVAAFAAAAALAPAALADHTCTELRPGCMCPEHEDRGQPLHRTPLRDSGYYLTHAFGERPGLPELLGVWWLYEESNGEYGLQRHDDGCASDGVTSDADADTLLARLVLAV